VLAARARGVPLEGVCLYPIIDRHDWDNPAHWHHSGLWDVKAEGGVCRRILNAGYAREFACARARLAAAGCV
jgi:hypothetical protein